MRIAHALLLALALPALLFPGGLRICLCSSLASMPVTASADAQERCGCCPDPGTPARDGTRPDCCCAEKGVPGPSVPGQGEGLRAPGCEHCQFLVVAASDSGTSLKPPGAATDRDDFPVIAAAFNPIDSWDPAPASHIVSASPSGPAPRSWSGASLPLRI